MQKGSYSIILADDHAIFRKGLRLIIENDNIGEIVGEASNGKEFLGILETIKPDLAIVDIDMPIMDGFEATKQALLKFPDLNILVLSMHGDQNYYNQMIIAGVKGFVLKTSNKEELVQAIVTVAEGGSHFSNELLRKIIFESTSSTKNQENELKLDLTEKELEILIHICSGLTINEIADKVCLGTKSIEAYRAKLLKKTGTKNTISLVLFAIKNKIVSI